ncbi:MAG: Rab family GTPase [Candidatus Helarchaeota archaeon]
MTLKDTKVLKMVIVGSGGIGKTTLTKVFCDNEYVDQIMTIGIDIHTKEALLWGEKKIVLQIWDISGQGQFRFLFPDFVKSANGAILAFDRTSPASFRELSEWLSLLRTHEPGIPVFLIATKADLEYADALNQEMARQFAITHQLVGFEETSAKLPLNVDVPFRRLLEYHHRIEFGSDAIIFLGPTVEPEVPTTTMKEEPPVIEVSHDSGSQVISREVKFHAHSNTIPSRCPNCQEPLRESQIKLLRNGTRVLCQYCFHYI